MNAIPNRQFAASDAKRSHVPLLIGLTGPSGGGKTFSALRLATGIQTVTGGDIYFIDTESRRALHYADQFKFKHVPFDAPFGSLDYLALINGILQLNANFIFCFRAKNTSKPVKKNGKTEVETMGFMPIAGEEFVFEQTLNALLLPAAGGVPTWHSEQLGERTMIKLPEQFVFLRDRNAPLDEKIGASLARWAAGKERTKQDAEDERPPQREFRAQEVGPDDEQADERPVDTNTNDTAAKSDAEKAVDEVIAKAEVESNLAVLEQLIKDAEAHKVFMPEDQQLRLEIAFDKARNRLAPAEVD
jgi:ABC-type dipeptide/oligopeptide/nickel transport system ATPase subunit